MEAWLDLADIYTKLESLSDAEICVGKAKSKEFYYPRVWHSTGLYCRICFLLPSSCNKVKIVSMLSRGGILVPVETGGSGWLTSMYLFVLFLLIL